MPSPSSSADAPYVALAAPAVALKSPLPEVTAKCARLFAHSGGLEIDFRADRTDRGFHATRKTSGLPFVEVGQYGDARPDERFIVHVEGSAGYTTRPFTVVVNPSGSCYVEKDGMRDDDRIQCAAAVSAAQGGDLKNYDGCETRTDDPTPAPSTSPSPTPKPTSKDNPAPFCGRLVVNWPVVFDRMRPHDLSVSPPAPTRTLKICTGFADRAAQAADLSCSSVTLAESDGSTDPEQFHQDRDFGDGSPSQASPTPDANAANAAARRRPAAATGSSPSGSSMSGANSSGSGTGTGLAFTGDVANPFTVTHRLSLAVAKLDYGQILDRLHQNLAAAAKQVIHQFSNALDTLGCKAKQCPDYTFKGVDSDVFGRVPSNAFRAGTSSTFLSEEVDLKPLDFTTVQNVNYGGKYVFRPLEKPLAFGSFDQNFGVAWYRDIANVATGTAFHYDRDLDDHVGVGVTYVVANNDPKSNVYRTDTHTANAVFGVVGHLLADRSLNVMGRFGNLAAWKGPGGNDKLGVLSYAPTGGGTILDAAGSTLAPFASVGYRALDAGYDPLGTTYDEFTGTQSAFATVGIQRKAGDPDAWMHNRDLSLSLTGVRAWDAAHPRYNAMKAMFSIAYSKGKNITFTHTRSNIASSVYARQDGSVLISDKDDGLTLLRNDADELKIDTLKSSVVSASAGLSWSNAPSDCSKTPAPHCNVKYHRKGTASLTVNTALLLDASVSFAPDAQARAGQKSVASNTLDPKLTLAYQNFCYPNWRLQPAVTYDRNVAENGNAFVRGDLIEARLDYAPKNRALFFLGPTSVLRFSYKLETDQSNRLVPAPTHPLSVSFVWDQPAQNFKKYCDDKLNAAKENQKTAGS